MKRIAMVVALAWLLVGCGGPHGPAPYPGDPKFTLLRFGHRHMPKPPVPAKVMWQAVTISQFVGLAIR